MANTYDIGDLARVTVDYARNGSAIDPTTVSLVVRAPDGTPSTYVYGTDVELVRVAQGSYRVDLDVEQAGIYRYRWTSTGTGKDSEESWFEVRPRLVEDEA